MKAILTRYLGPSTHRPARIIAEDMDGNRFACSRHCVGFAHLDGEALHRKAAEALRNKMGWLGKLHGGAIKTGYAWVFANGARRQ